MITISELKIGASCVPHKAMGLEADTVARVLMIGLDGNVVGRLTNPMTRVAFGFSIPLASFLLMVSNPPTPAKCGKE